MGAFVVYSSSNQNSYFMYVYMHSSDTEFQGSVLFWCAVGLKPLSSA